MQSKKGFTLVEIMIVVGIIGLLAAIAIPGFIQAQRTSRTNVCVNNLRQIDAAKQQWSLLNNKAQGDPCAAADIQDYIKGPFPLCPAGDLAYNVNNVGVDPTCGSGLPGHTVP